MSGARGGSVPIVMLWMRTFPPAATRPGICVPPVLAVNVFRAKIWYCPGTPGAAQSAAIARLGSAASAASTQTTTQRGMAAQAMCATGERSSPESGDRAAERQRANSPG